MSAPLDWRALTLAWADRTASARLDQPGPVRCGPWVVDLDVDRHVGSAAGGSVLRWAVRNDSAGPLPLDAITVHAETAIDPDRARALCYGWQSWSPTRVIRLDGSALDPAVGDGGLDLIRAVYHADPRPPADGATRSEAVTLVDRGDGSMVVAGALGASEHDTTLWFRAAGRRLPVDASAWFGGAVLQPGERRELHPVLTLDGTDPAALLTAWCDALAARRPPRASGPALTGWCSWYRWFHDITEHDLRANLAALGEWPFDLVQLDDGFQAQVGDWLEANDRFPSGLERLASDIGEVATAGLWLAPFLAHPASEVARAHPDWFATDRRGAPLLGAFNPAWGGVVHVLDPTHPEVEHHLEALGGTLTGQGWRYLKLDFAYVVALAGTYRDVGATPAQRVRRGFEAVRRGAPDSTLLACGAPLGPVVGLVDAARIGEDITLPEFPRPIDALAPGYARPRPVMSAPWRSVAAWAPMHRRLWQNDPDCVVLGPRAGQLTAAQVEAWADRVAGSGGLLVVSDDLPSLPATARRRFADLVATSRRVDDAARAGVPPAMDPFDTEVPPRLRD